MKGYDSQTRDSQGWKPLHLPTSYKARERRVVKKMAKTHWFKSREEQGLETSQPSGRPHPAGKPATMEPSVDEIVNPSILLGGSRLDTTPAVTAQGMAVESVRWNKKRGGDEPALSLRGRKRLEKSVIKKEKRRINRQLGRAGVKKPDTNPIHEEG